MQINVIITEKQIAAKKLLENPDDGFFVGRCFSRRRLFLDQKKIKLRVFREQSRTSEKIGIGKSKITETRVK